MTGNVHLMTPAEPVAIELPALANVEAEAALLGGMMMSAKIIDPVLDVLSSEDFYEPVHGRIFAAIAREHGAGRLANPITLRPAFDGDAAFRELGGVGYLAQLTGSGAAVIGASSFARQIKDLAKRRLLVAGLVEVIGQARQCDEDLSVSIAGAESIIAEASGKDDDAEEISAGKAAERVVNNLSKAKGGGVLCGIEAIDITVGGLMPQSMTILAGRPAMGKTAVAGGYALGAAKRGHGTLFLSHEMSADDLAERMLADMCFDDERTRVPYGAITSGHVNDEQARNLARAALALSDLPLEIVDVANATPAKIKRLIRRYKRRFEARGLKLELVVVDYLQLVQSDQREKDLYTRVTEVSKGLKRAFKETGVAGLVLAQLSRAVEQRADKRPTLSDLRDSGQIEQDADAVCFLYRPEYYLQQAKPELEEQLAIWEQACDRVRGIIEYIVPKRRRGSAATGRGWFHGSYQAVR